MKTKKTETHPRQVQVLNIALIRLSGSRFNSKFPRLKCDDD